MRQSLCLCGRDSHLGLRSLARTLNATSIGRIMPEGRLCLDRLPTTATPAFFPSRKVAAFLAETKKQADAVLRFAAGLKAAGRSLLGPGPPSRLRWSRPDNRTETTMATIGTFTAS